MRQIQKGSVDRSVDLYIIDATDGTPEVGVLYNTAGIDLKYRRDLSAAVSITEATLAALTTAHTDGGFLEIGNGVYRLDLPDAAWATGADHVTVFGTVTGMIVLPVTVQLVAYDPESALATPTNITAGTITTATNVTTLNGIAANVITAASIAADAITDAKVAADVTIASVTGAVGSVAGQTLANLDVASSTLATAANLATVAGYIDTEVAAILAAVDTEVAAIKAKTDLLPGATMAELAQGIPPATPSLEQAIMALYMALRNKLDVTATTKSVTNDAGTVIFKKALSDDGTTYSEAEAVSGP